MIINKKKYFVTLLLNFLLKKYYRHTIYIHTSYIMTYITYYKKKF